MSGAAEILQIVQIGDVSLHMHLLEWHGTKLKARGKADTLLDTYRVVVPNAPYLTEIQSVSLRVVIYADCGMSKSQIYNSLAGLVGQLTDVIAVEVIDCRSDAGGGCCACCNSRAQLLWLHTMGRVTDVTFTGEDFMSYQCELEIELYGYWKGLNQATWKCGRRDEAMPFENVVDGPDLPLTRAMVAPAPLGDEFFTASRILSWQRRVYTDDTVFYDPGYWMTLFAAEVDETTLPRRRYGSDWNTVQKLFMVDIPKDRWTAPAQSVYVFKNLVSETQVRIQVDRESNVWYLQRDIVTVDIADLSALMTANSFTLQNTDVLVLGDVQNMPGFVMRDGEPLVYVAEVVERTGSGAWCGQVTPGRNRIVIKGGTYAQHHVFRRL